MPWRLLEDRDFQPPQNPETFVVDTASLQVAGVIAPRPARDGGYGKTQPEIGLRKTNKTDAFCMV
jgi:hypothetical protein